MPFLAGLRLQLGEALTAVDWFALGGLKWDSVGFSAFSTFHFEHSFLSRKHSPLLKLVA